MIKYNYFTAKIDILLNNPIFVTPGFPKLNYDDANALAQDYKFKAKYAGCTVSGLGLFGIDNYNKQMKIYIDELNEEYWIHEYNMKYDSLVCRQLDKLHM